MSRPTCIPNPDEIWSHETMAAQMAARQIDALNALCPVPTMDDIFRELAEEREVEARLAAGER